MLGTGDDSATVIRLGTEADILNIRATGGDGADADMIPSATDVFSGAGNDTINISSDADGDRINVSGDPMGDLDGILGNICVFGEEHEVMPIMTETVTAKPGVIDKEVSVTVIIPRGDELNISDEASATDNTYELTDTMFRRTAAMATGMILYETIETLNIETGSGNDNFDVIDTADNLPDGNKTTIDTDGGNDTITVTDTGVGSILLIDTGIGDDTVAIATTGGGSVTKVTTDGGDDDVTVTTTGAGSGLEIDTESVSTWSTCWAPATTAPR